MLLRRRWRAFATVALALSSGFSTGCETSRINNPLADLTDAEIEQLEREIMELPEDSVILKVLGEYLHGGL
jgi:hypothetical protein